jgi:DNA-binding protein HU-beta
MVHPLTKAQLIAALAAEMRSDKKTASKALEALVSVVTNEVASGGAVTLPGIGKFYSRQRPERMIRNPATGEQVRRSADSVVKVIVAKSLREAISGGGGPDGGTDDPGPMDRRRR